MTCTVVGYSSLQIWLLKTRHPWVFRNKWKSRLSGVRADECTECCWWEVGSHTGLALTSLQSTQGRQTQQNIFVHLHQCPIIYANTISQGDEYFHVIQGFSFCGICSFLLRGFIFHWPFYFRVNCCMKLKFYLLLLKIFLVKILTI